MEVVQETVNRRAVLGEVSQWRVFQKKKAKTEVDIL